MKKEYPNTPKSRREIPCIPGAYSLKNKKGDIIYTGESNCMKRRMREHHSNKGLRFSSVIITPTKSKSYAKNIEHIRLMSKMPEKNKSTY